MGMNPEIKAAWVERLRALPNDMQGKHMLKNSNTGQMCCLGVLTEMAVEAGVIEPGKEIPLGGVYEGKVAEKISYYDDSDLVNGDTVEWDGVTPPKVAKWAGLAGFNPAMIVDGKTTTLATLNDSGKTFDEIADVISDKL